MGACVDRLVALGGGAILAEFPELCGVEQNLVNRCQEKAVAERFIQIMRDYAAQAKAVGSGFDMNSSLGNIRDGLITDAIKSAGAAKKAELPPSSMSWTTQKRSPRPADSTSSAHQATTSNPPPPWPEPEPTSSSSLPASAPPQETPFALSSKSPLTTPSPKPVRKLSTSTPANHHRRKNCRANGRGTPRPLHSRCKWRVHPHHYPDGPKRLPPLETRGLLVIYILWNYQEERNRECKRMVMNYANSRSFAGD